MAMQYIDSTGVYEYTIDPKTGRATIVGGSPLLHGKVALPTELDGHPVTGLGKGAFSTSSISSVVIPGCIRVVCNASFYWCSELTSVVFEEGVEEIEDSAFAVCAKLRVVKFPSTMRRIGGLAFHRCNALWSVTFNTGLESIGDDAFAGCPRIHDLALPEGLVSIGDRAFLECTGLARIAIPKTLANLSSGLFFRCTGLREAVLPEGLASLGSRAFAGCSELSKIRIPASVTDLGSYTFDGCPKLAAFDLEPGNPKYRSVDGLLCTADGAELIRVPEGWKGKCRIPEGVRRIRRGAFEHCPGVKKLILPASLAEFDDTNLCECTLLESIEVPEKNASFEMRDNLLMSKDGKTVYFAVGDRRKIIGLADGVETIHTAAFKGKLKLQKIVFPETLRKMGEAAFGCCDGLQEVRLPSSLLEIPPRAFHDCHKLERVAAGEGLVKVGKQAFANCTRLASVAIPPDAVLGDWAFDRCAWKP